MSLASLGLEWHVAIALLCGAVIGVAGTRLSRVVDQLADRTGIGEAMAGAVLLGAATSLSGSIVSMAAAWKGHAELAIGNALGGIAVQTLFLSLADMALRRVNLEHAAASVQNLMHGSMLVCMLALILIAGLGPEVTIAHVHPVTPLLFAAYGYGLRLIDRNRGSPMWQPTRTRETRVDEPDEGSSATPLRRLWVTFALLAGCLAVSGGVLEISAGEISRRTVLSQALIGVLFTSTLTSLPELVTSVAAVRRGALTLAVGGILGGNVFDTLFAAASDLAYREGSVYHAAGGAVIGWAALSQLMTGVLLLGLLRRQKHGPGGIGFESAANIALYVAGAALLFAAPASLG